MNGDESLHLDYRKRVCEYMLHNRDQFEPFVAALIDESDDETNSNSKKSTKTKHSSKNNNNNNNSNMDAYELYIKNLEKPGTYADNGVLVAFSRLFNLDINIHQLDQPIWTISGAFYNGKKSNQQIRQLHLSYHNGEHYSSIRPKGDRTNNPTNIIVNNNNNNNNYASAATSASFQSSNKNNNNSNNFFETNNLDDYVNDDDFNPEFNQKFNETTQLYNNLNVETIMDSTGCNDVNLILQVLEQNNGDLETAIISLMSKMHLNQEDNNDENENENDESKPNKSTSSKQIKMDKKKDKKSRQMERQRIKILEQREKESAANRNNKDIKSNQIIDLDNNRPDNSNSDYNVLLNNIEKKSI